MVTRPHALTGCGPIALGAILHIISGLKRFSIFNLIGMRCLTNKTTICGQDYLKFLADPVY